MAHYAERRREPLEVAQKIRDLLDEAEAHVEPIVYTMARPVNDGPSIFRPPPQEVEVEIRFRIRIP